MDRKLLDYLPPVLREVMEMQAINKANEPEIAIAWDALTLVLANQFLETADARGVSVWEQELNILPKGTDSLALRKARIKARWNIKLPYSLPWLRGWLTGIYGPDRHEETVENYTLHVLARYGFADSLNAEVFETLRTVIPANMLICATDKFEPAVLDNRQALFFQSLLIGLGADNPVGASALERVLMAVWVRQRQERTTGLTVRAGVSTSLSGTLARLLIHIRACNLGQGVIYLDGRRRLDGTWRLDQGTVPGPALSKVAVTARAAVGNRASAAVTADTMWRLDGSNQLDGTKKLNAAIRRSDL